MKKHIKRIKETVKKLVKDWRFYAWITAAPIAVFLFIMNFPKIFVLFGPLFIKLEALMGKPVQFWLSFVFATVIMLIVAFCWLVVFPLSFFLLGKIRCYLSLVFVCIIKRYKIRITRIPFASLFGISKKEDIRVTVGEIDYCIHFIDTPFFLRRQIVIINENLYCITKQTPDSVTRMGYGVFDKGTFVARYVYAAASSETEWAGTKKFPEFSYVKGKKHVIMSSPKPIASKVVTINRFEDLYNGSNIGRLLYYSRKGFIKFLKR